MTRKQAQKILALKGFILHLKHSDGTYSAAKRDAADREVAYCRASSLPALVLKVVGGHARPRT